MPFLMHDRQICHTAGTYIDTTSGEFSGFQKRTSWKIILDYLKSGNASYATNSSLISAIFLQCDASILLWMMMYSVDKVGRSFVAEVVGPLVFSDFVPLSLSTLAFHFVRAFSGSTTSILMLCEHHCSPVRSQETIPGIIKTTQICRCINKYTRGKFNE